MRSCINEDVPPVQPLTPTTILLSYPLPSLLIPTPTEILSLFAIAWILCCSTVLLIFSPTCAQVIPRSSLNSAPYPPPPPPPPHPLPSDRLCFVYRVDSCNKGACASRLFKIFLLFSCRRLRQWQRLSRIIHFLRAETHGHRRLWSNFGFMTC